MTRRGFGRVAAWTVRVCAAVATIGATTGAAHAQPEWPTRPIRIVAPSAPGGITDQIARIVAERMTAALKVAVVVENRTGGTGAVALDAIAKAPPDGYTIGIGFTGANIILPLLNDKLAFNAQRDFTPIGQVNSGGNLLVVHPSMPMRSFAEFLAYVKAQPQPPSYGSWGPGSGGHLAGEYLKILTGIRMTHVPYRTTTALMTDMVGGHMPMGFLDIQSGLAQVRAGKLRALAQTGPTRSPSLPDVPTMLDAGVPFGIGSWIGFFGPANLPRPIVVRVNELLNGALNAPELAERWLAMLGSAPAPTTPEAFERIVRDDWEVWKKVIVEGRITLE